MVDHSKEHVAHRRRSTSGRDRNPLRIAPHQRTPAGHRRGFCGEAPRSYGNSTCRTRRALQAYVSSFERICRTGSCSQRGEPDCLVALGGGEATPTTTAKFPRRARSTGFGVPPTPSQFRPTTPTKSIATWSATPESVLASAQEQQPSGRAFTFCKQRLCCPTGATLLHVAAGHSEGNRTITVGGAVDRRRCRACINRSTVVSGREDFQQAKSGDRFAANTPQWRTEVGAVARGPGAIRTAPRQRRHGAPAKTRRGEGDFNSTGSRGHPFAPQANAAPVILQNLLQGRVNSARSAVFRCEDQSIDPRSSLRSSDQLCRFAEFTDAMIR